MEIIRMLWERKEIPLKRPFSIALGTTTTYTGWILKICTLQVCGYGEAVPSPRITGDTMGSIEEAFKAFKRIIIGEDPRNIGRIMNHAESLLIGNTSAKAALNMALYDLLGKTSGLRVSDFIGNEMQRLETSVTVGITKPDEAVKRAIELVDSGAKVIKVKIGGNPEEDIARVREIRYATDVKIRVDANQGYSLKRAIKVLKAIERYDIEFAEQPINRHLIDDLHLLRKSVEIPIIADESVHRKEDVLRLIGKVDGINIKLMKSGGITEAIKMASIAKAAGMKIMVGCMVESKLAISAGVHFALGIGADYADLDGYWDLAEQPFEADIYSDGYIKLPDAPGLGVRETSS